MKGTRSYPVSYLLAATLAACAVVTAACGSGNAAPSAGVLPASSHTAAEKAATPGLAGQDRSDVDQE